MLFIFLVIGLNVAGVCATLALLPSLRADLCMELVAVLLTYAAITTLLMLAYGSMGTQDHTLGAAALVKSDIAGVEERTAGAVPQQHQSMHAAHGFCLRHIGLRHAVMLSYAQESAYAPIDSVMRTECQDP